LLGGLLALACGAAVLGSEPSTPFRLATFSADVTVPIGHGMMGGAWTARSVADPLYARGVVLLGPDLPIVIVAIDWCEIRSEAYERWQVALADAAGTRLDRVLLAAVHQHDAPVADLEAERILRASGGAGSICDLDFHEHAVTRTAAALRASLASARPVTHIGTGRARVRRVASNRRYITPQGEVRFDRMSRSTDPAARRAAVGIIDPWLRTLTFWEGERALAALSTYAVHPMSYYGAGDVSADFPGLARARRQAETPECFQIYFSGCSGNVVAGKYNTGTHRDRVRLAGALHRAMKRAFADTRRAPLARATLRNVAVPFEPRQGPGWSEAELRHTLTVETNAFRRCLTAMSLSWLRRVQAGHRVQVPMLELGPARFLLLPGESYVEFQLAAQRLASSATTVLVAGYGECATGYIPTDRHIAEGDTNLGDWCWVAPGSEARLLAAIAMLLTQPGAPQGRSTADLAR
jgi:hypothetical protein